MRVIISIALREFKSFVFSPSYLMTSGFFVAFLSFSYLVSFQTFIDRIQNGNINPLMMQQPLNFHSTIVHEHINWVNLLFLLFIPLLMGRLLSEEKKMRSFDLLMTSPISSSQIVMGKYIGGMLAVLVLIFLAFIYPMSASVFAELQWAKLFAAFIGLTLISGIYAGVGLFCSSLTDSIVLAAIGGVLLNIALWTIAFFRLHAESEWSIAFIDHVSLGVHLDAFLKGVISSGSLVFCLSLIFIFCFLAERIVESTRWR